MIKLFVFVFNKKIYMFTSYQKESLNNRWSIIPPISTKRRITFHPHSLNTKKTTTCYVVNTNHVYIQCIRLLRNTFIVCNVMNYLITKHQWLSNKEHSFTLGVISSFRCTVLTKKTCIVVRDEYNCTKLAIWLLLL